MGAYRFYLRRVMPAVAGLLSPDEGRAYRYLADSVDRFPSPEELRSELEAIGFSVAVERMTLGVVALHVATRPV